MADSTAPPWLQSLMNNAQNSYNAANADEIARKKALLDAANASGDFAGFGQGQYMQLGHDADGARAMLQRQATGELSYSKEALRQALMQQQNAQRSFAASASPQNAAMAARTAAINMGRAQSGTAGQSALAGIAEQQAAQKALADMILAQRQQEMQVALGSRGNQINALAPQPIKPKEPGFGDKLLGIGAGLLGTYVGRPKAPAGSGGTGAG